MENYQLPKGRQAMHVLCLCEGRGWDGIGGKGGEGIGGRGGDGMVWDGMAWDGMGCNDVVWCDGMVCMCVYSSGDQGRTAQAFCLATLCHVSDHRERAGQGS